MAFTTLFAVSSLIKDVVIPLLAAAVTATGIVVPLLAQRNRDRKETSVAYERALRSIHRDAAFLVEQVQLIGLKHAKGEDVSVDQLAPVMTASARLVSRLFDDPRIFDSYFRGPGKPEIVSVPKLLLLLGEFEVRLKTLASAPNVILPLFVASLLTYFGEEDGKEREELRRAMTLSLDGDKDIRALASAVVPTLVPS